MRTILLGVLAHLYVAAFLLLATDHRQEAVALPAALVSGAVIYMMAGWTSSLEARSRMDLASRCFGVVALGWLFALSVSSTVDYFELQNRLGLRANHMKCWYCPGWWESLVNISTGAVVLGLIAAALSPLIWAVRRRSATPVLSGGQP